METFYGVARFAEAKYDGESFFVIDFEFISLLNFRINIFTSQ